MKTLLGLSVFLLCTAAAHAELYKWVDEQGNIHYSDQPAGGKAKSESKLNIPNQPASATGTDAPKTWQDKELDYKKRQASTAEAEAKKQKEAQEAKTARDNCNQAKGNLSQLQSIAPAYTFDEKTGRNYLNAEQRADAIDKARKSVADWCK